MVYQVVKSATGEYAVDWEFVEKFTRSYWISHYRLVYKTSVNMAESSWYNPLSWPMPSISTVEVDWEKVEKAAASACSKDMQRYLRYASLDMRGIAHELKSRVVATADQSRKFRETLRDTQELNLSAIKYSEDSYKNKANIAEFLRDASADTLVIGSTIATGGLGGAMLAAGAALKGAGKYQETGSVGAAALYGVGTVAVGYFKCSGSKVSAAAEYGLIFVQGGVEASTSWVAGKSFSQGIETGALKVVSSGVAQTLFDRAAVKKLFEKMPLPFNITHKMNGQSVDVTNKLVEKGTKKVTEKTVKQASGQIYKSKSNHDSDIKSASNSGSSSRQGSTLLDSAPVYDMLLFYFTIIHMEKGVGRGY